MIICIDPGTWTHGIVVMSDDGTVIAADSAAPTQDINKAIDIAQNGLVVIERVELYSDAGKTLGLTMEHSARFVERATLRDHDVHWLYRRQVKMELGIRGKNTDAIVAARVKEHFGFREFVKPKLCPKRKNKSHGDGCSICAGSGLEREPGRFADVTGHAMQALAVWLAYVHGARTKMHEKPAKKVRR